MNLCKKILCMISMLQIFGTTCEGFSLSMSRAHFLTKTAVSSLPFLENPRSDFGEEGLVISNDDTESKTSAINIVNNDVYFCGELNEENIVKLTNTFLTAESNLEKAKEQRKEGRMMIQEIGNNTIITTPPVLPDHLNFYIQSPGGSFLSTLSLVDTLINLKIPIYTYVHGYTASAATLLSIIGKKRYMYKHAVMLIHGIKLGNSNPTTVADVRDIDYNVKIFMEIMKSLYFEHTKLSEEKLDELLSKDIYLTASEAYQYGLVDEII